MTYTTFTLSPCQSSFDTCTLSLHYPLTLFVVVVLLLFVCLLFLPVFWSFYIIPSKFQNLTFFLYLTSVAILGDINSPVMLTIQEQSPSDPWLPRSHMIFSCTPFQPPTRKATAFSLLSNKYISFKNFFHHHCLSF